MSRMAPASEVPPAAVASVAELVGGIPGPGRPGRRSRLPGILRRQTRPERIRGMAAVAVLLAVFLGLIAAAIFGSVAGGLRLIGQQSEPEVLATTDLYFRLNDMDAQVANVLLVGGQRGLGIDRQQAQAIYEQDRVQADQDLQRAAVVAGSVPSAQQSLRSVLDGLGSYEALAGEAMYLDGQGSGSGRPGRPPAAALTLYRQATDLLQGSILPSARSLTNQNAASLDAVYQAKRSAARSGAWWVARCGATLLAVLVGMQIYFAVRYRRIFNPGLAVATLVAVTLVAASAVTLSAAAGQLHVAKAEAFDSIIALSQARALSDDANADESRYLVDPARAGQYQQAFENKSQQLVQLARAGIFQYDAALARAISAYRANHADIGFGGYFGAEFRNITFAGERAAAEQTLAAYQVYERDDRHIRALNRSGDLRAAIAFDTSYAPGNSNWAFTQYDNALAGLIAINQRAFTGAISAGQQDMNGWTGYIPAGAAILIIILVLAGVRPRLAEYR
ncbi:MAG: hypothetical protein ACLP8X_36665 [Streptosporangiaceae bacterium]